MAKILSAAQVRTLDAHTIATEPIASIDLMERASTVFCDWFTSLYPAEADTPIVVFAGTGNNGGDGLAVARLLTQRFYEVTVYHCLVGTCSPDNEENLRRLTAMGHPRLHALHDSDELPVLPEGCIIIDAIFGAGLTRPVSEYWAALIFHLNGHSAVRVAIDIPSGLPMDACLGTGAAICAHHTLSFELPKLTFLLAEHEPYVGQWTYLPIGLSAAGLAGAETDTYYTEIGFVRGMLLTRPRHGHKGTFGHALVVAGSLGKVGAAVLATRACLRSGAGLVTAHVPADAGHILQAGVPEAMVSLDAHQHIVATLPGLAPYRAIGIGSGMGQAEHSALAFGKLLDTAQVPLVIDADALNILAEYPRLMALLPKGSLLTPHPGEFARLFGHTTDSLARIEALRERAQALGVYIVLKGAHTCIATPEGDCYFNSTGNSGMATGGSGDVLTGLLTGLLAQGYPPFEAAVLGVYLHGLSGDIAATTQGQEALVAGDLIEHLGLAFRVLRGAPAP